MNLTKLRHVTEVARRGSFSRAAASTSVTQSAVTKSVADVERQIGFEIFRRTSRGAELTDRGREFVDRAARILADADDLLCEASTTPGEIEGRLRVGVCPASFEWMLVEPAARFLAGHPSVVLDVKAGPAERITQLLTRGDIDVALGPEVAFGGRPELAVERQGEVTTHLFHRAGHPLDDRRRIGRGDVARFPFIASDLSYVRPLSQVIDTIYEACGEDPRRWVHSVDYFPLVRRIVLATDAISIVESGYSESRAFRSQFTTRKDLALFPPIEISCATQRRWPPKPATTAWIHAFRTSRFLH